MADKLLDDPGMPRAMLVLTVLEAIVVEVALIITLSHSSKPHSPAGLVLMLAAIFVSSVPAVAGIMGYRLADKLRPTPGIEDASGTATRLQILFLGMTAATYGAIITVVTVIADRLRAN